MSEPLSEVLTLSESVSESVSEVSENLVSVSESVSEVSKNFVSESESASDTDSDTSSCPNSCPCPPNSANDYINELIDNEIGQLIEEEINLVENCNLYTYQDIPKEPDNILM